MRCVQICDNIQGMHVWDVVNTGSRTTVNIAKNKTIQETKCTLCGQCVVNCPVGALRERDDVGYVLDAVENEDIITVVQIAPAVRTAWGEGFGLSKEFATAKRLVSALRKVGFDYIFDTTFSADLTIMEEGSELLHRLPEIKESGLPMFTSCCPGWVNFVKKEYPQYLERLSTAKSPQQMFGAVTKSYYAEKEGIDPKDIVSVSVMPCTAKKFEIGRDDEDGAGYPDVDIAITTRELARMIERAGIQFLALPDEKFDDPLGVSTGAAVIFGATGGVMEAALRTAVEELTGEELPSVDFVDVRGTEGIKEASYDVAGMNVKVAVASGLSNARELLNKVKNGEADYQFIEIMGCPGGCVNGGGQPQQPASVRNFTDIRALRAKVLYDLDESREIRKSHENPVIKELYSNYLGEPGSHKAHELLHTTYVKRSVN